MADPTYTLAGLQTEFNALITAVEGEDFKSARIKLIRVRAVIGGLPSSAQTDGAVLSIRGQIDDIQRLLESTEREVSQAANTERLMRWRVSHG